MTNVAQFAALAALDGRHLDSVAAMHEAFDRRRRTIHRLLNEIPGVTCTNPQGAFYAFPSLQGVLGRSINGRRARTTLELAEIVLDEANVAFVPGEAFGAPGLRPFLLRAFRRRSRGGRPPFRRPRPSVPGLTGRSHSGHETRARGDERWHASSSPKSSPRAGSTRWPQPGTRSTSASDCPPRRSSRRSPAPTPSSSVRRRESTPSVLAAGRDLVVVGRAGVGLDNVDVAEATGAGSWSSTRRSRTSCRRRS